MTDSLRPVAGRGDVRDAPAHDRYIDLGVAGLNDSVLEPRRHQGALANQQTCDKNKRD